jgi:hypothetical protein
MTAEKMKVPLIMEQFALTEFSFRLMEDEKKLGVPSGTISIHYGLTRMDLPAPHKLVLQVVYAFSPPQADGARFEVKATVVGFFKAPEDIPDEERDARLKRHGLSMLYGALRGLVLPFSGAFPPGVRCILPTVNMVQVVEDAERGAKAARVKEVPTAYTGKRRKSTTTRKAIKAPSKHTRG